MFAPEMEVMGEGCHKIHRSSFASVWESMFCKELDPLLVNQFSL